MITLKIIKADGTQAFCVRDDTIRARYKGEWQTGDTIQVLLDGCSYVWVQFDKTLAKSLLYVPNKRFEFVIPDQNVRSACYHPDAFTGREHELIAEEAEEGDVYARRNLALNSHDQRGKTRAFPHASANFVTREEPCFYERNAIDGEKNNQGHGGYPYQSWAGGARGDLAFTLDFGQEVSLDSLVFYLRADFARDSAGEPHDSYWKQADVRFSDGEVVQAHFRLNRECFPCKENERGIEIKLPQSKQTQSVTIEKFVQVTEVLSFAALTQIEAYGQIIKKENKTMEVRQASNAKDVKYYTTERLREEFLIDNLFTKDNVRMVYSHIDRIITAGLMPVRQTLSLQAGKELAADYFLQRREMGCINIGGAGVITVDGKEYHMNPRDGIYVGMGNKEITFKSDSDKQPAKFYVSSCPAHTTYPTVKIDITKAKKVPCGSAEACNKRVINQYIHPEVMKSCQLAMGLTELAEGSNWNTMPCHTHDRRMEVYLYLDMSENDVVFHLMGEPNETRHIVMHNEQAVISPSWSIHSGVGTRNYSFIWAMCGENQEFTDMDGVETCDLK